MSLSGTQDCLFCGRAAMIAAAIACLLQPTSAFISNGVSVFAGSHPGGTEWAPSATHRLRATTPPNHRGAFTAYQHETGRSAVACLRRRSSMLMITAAPAPSPAAASERLSSETSQSLKIGVEITASEAAEASAAATEAATEAATAGAAGGVLDRVKPAVRSISDAKHELLHLFSLSSAGKQLTANQEERAGLLLEMLEDNYTPIQTVAFFNLAVQGDWHLAYTNSPMKPVGPRFEVSELYQRIEAGEGAEGNLTNVMVWRLLDEDLSGRFEVDCGYRLDPKGRMNVSVRDHRLLPDKMPQDPQALVHLVQRAMPREMFNPDKHALDITFMDGSARLVRMRGSQLEGRLNVFRRQTELPSPPSTPSTP